MPNIKELTDLYGKLIKIGSDTIPTASIKILQGGRIINCRLKNKEIAKKLAENLYSFVHFRGQATLNPASWIIEKFSVEEVLPFEDRPLSETFDYLGKHFANSWIGGSFDEFMQDIR